MSESLLLPPEGSVKEEELRVTGTEPSAEHVSFTHSVSMVTELAKCFFLSLLSDIY